MLALVMIVGLSFETVITTYAGTPDAPVTELVEATDVAGDPADPADPGDPAEPVDPADPDTPVSGGDRFHVFRGVKPALRYS